MMQGSSGIRLKTLPVSVATGPPFWVRLVATGCARRLEASPEDNAGVSGQARQWSAFFWRNVKDRVALGPRGLGLFG